MGIGGLGGACIPPTPQLDGHECHGRALCWAGQGVLRVLPGRAVLTGQSSSTMKMVQLCTCMKEMMVAAIFFRITSSDCCSSKIRLARSSST